MSLKSKRNRKKLAGKARKGFRGYPLATITYYGPNDRLATKVVASIVAYEDAEPDPIEKWFSEKDVRNEDGVVQEVLQFLEEETVKSVAMLDRIIGCPHEEGIDYPEGEACPHCPFWKGRDRWTGEKVH